MKCLTTSYVFANARAFGGRGGRYEWEQRRSKLFGGSGPHVVVEYATQSVYAASSGLGLVHSWLKTKHMLPSKMFRRALVSVSVYTQVPLRVLREKGVYIHPASLVCYHVDAYPLQPVIELPVNFLKGQRVDRFIPLYLITPFMGPIFTQFKN